MRCLQGTKWTYGGTTEEEGFFRRDTECKISRVWELHLKELQPTKEGMSLFTSSSELYLVRRLLTSAETSGLSYYENNKPFSRHIVRKRMLEVISQIRSMSQTQLSCCWLMPCIPNPEMPLTRTTQLAELPLSCCPLCPSTLLGNPPLFQRLSCCGTRYKACLRLVQTINPDHSKVLWSGIMWKGNFSLILSRDFMPLKITPRQRPISQFHSQLGCLFEHLSPPYLKLLPV